MSKYNIPSQNPALTIIIGQLPKLLGIPVESGNVPEMLWREIGALDEIGWHTPVVGCASGRGGASRGARSSRPVTRSLVSGKGCP